jgi:hypothetical protein
MKRSDAPNDDGKTQLDEELLSKNEADFRAVVTRVLEKNRELYQRLR